MIQKLRLIQRAHRYRNRHDPAELEAIRRSLRPGCAVLDIGAHKGAYTYWMSKWARPGGRLIAIEPQPDLADKLRALYASSRDITVLHGAVGSTPGTITLHIPGEGPSHGASIRELEAEDGIVIRDVDVPCFTLESIATEHKLDRIDLIKCDTEGAERDIFRAGSEVLRRFTPTVLVECEKRHANDDADPVGELWAIFRELGYRGQCFAGGRLIPIDEFDYAKHQADPDDKPNYGNNFFFTHPEHKQPGGCGSGCACAR
ncbi:MAG: FkbM family methyltransferase [bacterium]|nr:FkbM family methyltransferase [bacterium]